MVSFLCATLQRCSPCIITLGSTCVRSSPLRGFEVAVRFAFLHLRSDGAAGDSSVVLPHRTARFVASADCRRGKVSAASNAKFQTLPPGRPPPRQDPPLDSKSGMHERPYQMDLHSATEQSISPFGRSATTFNGIPSPSAAFAQFTSFDFTFSPGKPLSSGQIAGVTFESL